MPSPPLSAQPVRLPPCALLGHLREARDLFRRQQFPAAWQATLAALQLRPFHPDAYGLLAEIAQAAGDTASARRCAEHARRLAPALVSPRLPLDRPDPTVRPQPAWLTLPPALTAPPLRLSICLIARNEEAFLDPCLTSVRGLADQIVLVDTGSTDRTVDIARAHGAEVHRFAWCDDFSAARNAALEHARGDWILMLDADEELPPESHAALRRLIGMAEALAWRLPIVDVGRENEGCSYVPRLFRNAPALFYLGRVHEQVFSSLEVRREAWGLANRLGDAVLRHHGYRPDVVKSRDKIQRNLRLLELAIQELPNEPHLLMNYGLELVRSGQLDAGIVQYQKAFACLAAQPEAQRVPELREMLLSQFCTQLMAAKRFAEVVSLLTSPLASAGGLTASLHFALGLAYLEQRQPAPAAEQMRQCLATRQLPALVPINQEIHKAGPRHCLARCLEQLGEFDAAAEQFRLALQDDPQSFPARLDQARFLGAHGQPVEALNLFFALTREKPDHTQTWWLGAQLALSRPEFLEVALDWTAEALSQASAHPALLHQRAEALTLAGQIATALPLWRQLAVHAKSPSLAGLVLCELISGETRFTPPPNLEPDVSREFLKLHQRLQQFQAGPALAAVHGRLSELHATLPSAAGVLAGVVGHAAG